MITLENIKEMLLDGYNPIVKIRQYGNNNVNQYKLFYGLNIQLSNGQYIWIPKGYVWDLASVPRVFQSIISTDNDAEIAYLIHDFLYENKIGTREFADKEMLKWAKVTNGINKIHIRNIDNYIRYYAVRLFGGKIYNKKK